MGGWWRRLTPLLGVALLAAAIYAVYGELAHHTLGEFWRTLLALPAWSVSAALALTVLNYAILTGYDRLAFSYIGRPMAWWRIAFASFIGYGVSNSVGFAMLSGATARYRFYSRWGLTNDQIVRIIGFYNATFWVGLLLLGGASLIVHPPGGLSGLAGYEWIGRWARPAGAVLLAIPIAYLVVTIVRREPVRWGRISVALPSMRIVAGQFLLSTLDWGLAGLILWVLIPAHHVSLVETMSAFFTAQFIGLLLQVPGALGVLEFGMVVLLRPAVPDTVLLPALLAYRAIYYLLPLLAALALLVADEWSERRHIVRRWGKVFGSLTISLAPPLIGGFAFVAGAILLFSGATPAMVVRLHVLLKHIPLPVVELSHFIGSLIGLGLLLLAQALIRRVDLAWTLAVASIVLGIVAEILKGLDYEEAAVLVVLLILLVRARREFDRRSNLFEHTFSVGWFVAVTAVVAASVLLGVEAFRNTKKEQELYWFLQASVAVAIVLLAFSVRFLLRPAAPALTLPTDEDLEAATRVIQDQRSATPYLVYLGDKALLWNDDRSAFLMYAISGRTWVALGDPVGPPRAVPSLVRTFLERVDEADGIPVFYQVRKDNLHRYADFGLAFAKAGEEALVPLQSFSLEGGSRKKMRLFWHKLEKDGATYRIIPPERVADELPQLRDVSNAWLDMKAGSEKGFSLGFFNERYLERFPVAVLEVAGRIEAFANVWPGPNKVELSVDLMRQRPTAPKNAMEGLFIYLMLWGKAEGYECFNLGMAPLSGLETTEFSSMWNRVASYLYRYGQTFYNFQGLRAYKDKFDPVWEPKYLAYHGGLSLPRVLRDLSALIAGGYRRALGR